MPVYQDVLKSVSSNPLEREPRTYHVELYEYVGRGRNQYRIRRAVPVILRKPPFPSTWEVNWSRAGLRHDDFNSDLGRQVANAIRRVYAEQGSARLPDGSPLESPDDNDPT